MYEVSFVAARPPGGTYTRHVQSGPSSPQGHREEPSGHRKALSCMRSPSWPQGHLGEPTHGTSSRAPRRRKATGKNRLDTVERYVREWPPAAPWSGMSASGLEAACWVNPERYVREWPRSCVLGCTRSPSSPQGHLGEPTHGTSSRAPRRRKATGKNRLDTVRRYHV